MVDLDGHVDWFCRPFRGKPSARAWRELLRRVARLHDHQPLDLVVIDAFANLAPMRSENDAVQMLDALKPLQALTVRGLATFLTHHPAKGTTVPGQAARGSGALSGYVDILMEMQPVSRRPDDRRRRLRAYSRHPATPPRLLLAWTADGTDYIPLGSAMEADFDHAWPVVQAILEQAEGPLTRRAIRDRWPDPALAPPGQSLWKWLGRAVQEGRALQTGRGCRNDPFLYSLPGMAEKWQEDFLTSFMKRLERGAVQNPPPETTAPPTAHE